MLVKPNEPIKFRVINETSMQFRAIADVAPVVTMATEAIAEMRNISIVVIVSVKFYREMYTLRNMKLKFSQMFMVTIATAAILEMVNIANALAHGGYRFC
jgi:hypothetical protein